MTKGKGGLRPPRDLEKARNRVLNRIGHNLEWRVHVTTCAKDQKLGNEPYSIICIGKWMALDWVKDVKTDCIATRAKCRAKIKRYHDV